MPKKEKIPTAKELGEWLLSDYKRWEEIYDNGCTDPLYADGVNINLIRSHIIYRKQRIEEILLDRFWEYPDCYFYPTPPQLPNRFMAKDRHYHNNYHYNNGIESKEPIKSNKVLPYKKVMSFTGHIAVKEVYGDNLYE